MRSFAATKRHLQTKHARSKRSARSRPTVELLECRLAPAAARFAVIGDFGSADQNELDVSNLVKSWAPDFILTTGDNNYPLGEASTIDANIGQYYHDFIAPYTGSYGSGSATNRFWPTLGNHDWGDGFIFPATIAPYLNYFQSLPGNGRYYDMTIGPVEFFMVDSDFHEPDGTSPTSVQGTWLQNELAASTATWKLVIFHEPPYGSADHGSNPNMRWPFQAWGASAVISGHNHVYERVIADNNFPYFVDGLGGNGKGGFVGTPVPGSQARYKDDYGAMQVNADDSQITFQFYSRSGTLVDSYALYTAPASVVPSAPINLTATAISTDTANITWTDSSSNETGFKVERYAASTGWVQIATVGPNVSNYSDTGLAFNSQYYYRVLATNALGDSGYSNAMSITTFAVVAPSNLAAAPFSNNSIQLSWLNNSGGSEDGFKIFRSTNNSSFPEVASVGSGVTAYVDTGLSASTLYYYFVRAFNSVGNSAFSNETSTTISTPAAPTSLIATAVSTSQVNLTWYDNATNETGFSIERSTDGINFTQIATTFPNPGVGSTEQTEYTDTGLTPGTAYYYRIRAINPIGSSQYSNQASTLLALPPAPSNFTATAVSTSQINLAWVDNSSNEAVFLIERSTDGVAFTQVASLGANVSSYSDKGLASTTYYYRVHAVNGIGSSGYSAVASDSTAIPLAPANLTGVVVSASEIDLFWTDNSNNEWGFKIEDWTPTTTWTQIAAVGANVTSYNATGLSAGSQHVYRVRAYDGAGNSAYTNQLSQYTSAPSAPSLLAGAPASSSQIDLSWKDNTTLETGFLVERSTDAVNFTQIASLAANTTAYSNTGLAANQTYYYRVRAYNGVGYSGYSAVASTSASVPAAPSNLGAAAISATQVNLSWTDNSNNESSFLVERSTDGVSFTQIGSVGANTTSYSDAGLTAGATYYYQVRAYNVLGYSGYSNLAVSATSSPAAPSNLAASAASTSQINLSWTDNSNNESNFLVERSTDGASYTQIASVASNTTSYSNTGLAANTTYYFRVRATNGFGNSAYTTVASANTTVPTVPTTPSSLTATAASTTQLNLSWTDTANDQSGFAVERWSSVVPAWTQIATVSASARTYSDAGLLSATQYYYRVRAYNGTLYSSYSNQANATTLSQPAPSNLVATALSMGQINLTWQNNNSSQLGVTVERWSSVNPAWTQIGTVGATATSYSDTGLTSGIKYYYRVRGYSAAGNSPYSNQASATTLAPAAPTNLTAGAASSSQINLAWQNNYPNQLGVKIERWSGSNPAWTQIATVGATATSYSDTGLTASTQYFYRVRAYDQSANSAYSSQASATTGATGGQADVNDATRVVESGVRGTIGWSASLGAAAGMLGIYVEDLASPDELARIQDAINAMDRAWDGSKGFYLYLVEDVSQANIIVHYAIDSGAGGLDDGVLGAAELSYAPGPTGEQDNGQPYFQITGQVLITLIQGWNWYTGSAQDGTTIGPDQYDYETVVIHELGHAVGLYHDWTSYGSLNGDGYSPMLPYLNAGQSRHNFSPGDVGWLDHLYVGASNPGVAAETEAISALLAGDWLPASRTARSPAVSLVSASSTDGVPALQLPSEPVNARPSSPIPWAVLVGVPLAAEQVAVISRSPARQVNATLPATSVAAAAEIRSAAVPFPTGADLGSGAAVNAAQPSDDEIEDDAAPDLGTGASKDLGRPAEDENQNLLPTMIEPGDYLMASLIAHQTDGAADNVISLRSWGAECDAYFANQSMLNISRDRGIPAPSSPEDGLVSSFEAKPLVEFAVILAAWGGRNARQESEVSRKKPQILQRDRLAP